MMPVTASAHLRTNPYTPTQRPAAANQSGPSPLMFQMPGDGDPNDGVYRIEDARAWAQAETQKFSSELGDQFRELGISMSPAPVLTFDGEGKVRVANDHPDKARIEKFFADNPDMRNRLGAISSASETVRLADRYGEYAKKYEQLAGNPAAQAALTAAEVAQNKSMQFNFAVSRDGGEVFFTQMNGLLAVG